MTGTDLGPTALPADVKCDFTRTTDEGRIWRCINKPHPNHPDRHYMQRDEVAEMRLRHILRSKDYVTEPGDVK
jgi:hypothetical protein